MWCFLVEGIRVKQSDEFSLLSLFGCQQHQESVMSLSKFSEENLAKDLMKPEIWRKTFTFLSIIELVRLREVCSTFKDEVHLLFRVQEKLGVFDPTEGPLYIHDPLHDIPNS